MLLDTFVLAKFIVNQGILHTVVVFYAWIQFFALQVLEFELKSSAQSSYAIRAYIHGKFVESIAKEEALNHAHQP
jgi:hypothetical protein